jgi:hypothetical protein
MQKELQSQGLYGYDYSGIKEIQEINSQLVELQKKKKELETKYNEQAQVEPRIRKEQYDQIEKIIKERQEKKKLQVPPELDHWVKKVWGAGMDWGYGDEPLKVTWISEDEKYLIITSKGTMYGSGIGNFNYGSASHMAIKAMEGTYRDGDVIHEVNGRLTNRAKEELIIAIKFDRENE